MSAFDEAKVKRIVEIFMAAIEVEDPTAGEACAAASFVFNQAITGASCDADRDGIREACIQAIRNAT
jgi:hypothetical protein